MVYIIYHTKRLGTAAISIIYYLDINTDIESTVDILHGTLSQFGWVSVTTQNNNNNMTIITIILFNVHCFQQVQIIF